jgi:MFS family permease
MSKVMQVLLLTMSALMLTTIALTTPLILAPVVTRELGLSPGFLGVYLSLQAASSALATLYLGGIVSRYGSVRVSQMNVVIMGLSLCVAAAGWPAALLFSSVLSGIGLAVSTPAASHLIMRVTPAHRLGMVFSVRQTGVPIGAAMAGAAIPALLLVMRWEVVALGIAVALCMAAVLYQPARAAMDSDRDAGASLRNLSMVQTFRLAVSNATLRGIAVSGLACSFVQNGLLAYLVTYLTLELDYSLVAAGLILTASQLAAIAGRMGWGWLSDRLGDPLKVLALLCFVSTLVCIALGSITAEWPVALVAVVAALFGATAVSWNGVFLGGVARFAPAGQVAAATSGSMVFVYIGALLGPALYAVILSVSGMYRAGYLLFAIVPLLAGLSVQSIRRRVRRAAG